jgi:phage-related protein
LPSERIARLIFFLSIDTELVVLHGFIKKTQATPAGDLDLARSRKLEYEEN